MKAHLINMREMPKSYVNNNFATMPTVDMCPFCFDFTTDAEDEIITGIINGGIIGGCGDLCGYVTNPYLGEACYLVCTIVGIEAFVEAFNITDPDPIYICQLMDLCPVVTGGAVQSTKASAIPSSVSSGGNVNITYYYQVTSPTGPGLLTISISSPGSEDLTGSQFTEGQPIGYYGIIWELSTTPSEQEPFSPGPYGVYLQVCEGDCTTVHPNGGVYASDKTSFSITS